MKHLQDFELHDMIEGLSTLEMHLVVFFPPFSDCSHGRTLGGSLLTSDSGDTSQSTAGEGPMETDADVNNSGGGGARPRAQAPVQVEGSGDGK